MVKYVMTYECTVNFDAFFGSIGLSVLGVHVADSCALMGDSSLLMGVLQVANV